MSKVLSANMVAHLSSDVTTLASCWHIQPMSGADLFLTDHDSAIVFGGNTYTPTTAYTRSAIDNNTGMSVDNMDLQGVLNVDIDEDDLRNGVFDNASVWVFLVNWANPDASGAIRLRYGKLGEVQLSSKGYFSVELRGITQPLIQQVGEVYSAECRAQLGDSRCKIPISPDEHLVSTAYEIGDSIVSGEVSVNGSNIIFEATTKGTTGGTAPTWDYTPGNETTDGGVTWVAKEGWRRTATIATVIDSTNFTVTFDRPDPRVSDEWYAFGKATWLTGNNSGRTIEISAYNSTTNQVEIYLPLHYKIEVGDTLSIDPGCDNRMSTCIDIFDNIYNMRAEPYVPGNDATMAIPDSPY